MIRTGFFSCWQVAKKTTKKKEWDLVPQRPIKRERKDHYLHGNPNPSTYNK